MTKKVRTVGINASLIEAVRKMNKFNIGSVVVVDTDRKRLVGIITERDVLKRVVSKSKNAELTKVSDIMSKPVVVGGPTMYIEDAAKLMFKKNIKKLPIMKNGQLVGIITLSDIAQVANIGPQIAKVIDELTKKGWLPSRRMKKVVDFYIA